MDLKVLCCHILPAFSGQLSSGDKDRLDGLFRKAFKRGLCSDVFHIDDLARDADTKLFRQASDQRHLSVPTAAQTKTQKTVVLPQKSRTQLHIATY